METAGYGPKDTNRLSPLLSSSSSLFLFTSFIFVPEVLSSFLFARAEDETEGKTKREDGSDSEGRLGQRSGQPSTFPFAGFHLLSLPSARATNEVRKEERRKEEEDGDGGIWTEGH